MGFWVVYTDSILIFQDLKVLKRLEIGNPINSLQSIVIYQSSLNQSSAKQPEHAHNRKLQRLEVQRRSLL